MPEWSTYELSNFLLFSPRTYERMLESYNAALRPWQGVAVLSGMAAVTLAAMGKGRKHAIVVTAILAASWIWVAWAFHLRRYAPINWAAEWFALAFVAQGVALVATGLLAGQDSRRTPRVARVGGLALSGFAILGLPLVERLAGRPWAQVEVFGLFPDATALATLGILAARERLHRLLLVIPFLWCVVGSGTLAALGRADAPVIAVAALASAVLVTWRGWTSRRPHAER